MYNAKMYPFERNHYFYGKLLSVEDFELEQKYMNDKRRLINRFLFGSGVVTGLTVVDVDEQTVSLEAGFALDCWGREIFVDEPVLLKLSAMEGFDACLNANADDVYLCMEYNEQDADRVHSIAAPQSAVDRRVHDDFDRTREGARLYLTAKEPEENIRPQLSFRHLRETQTVLYEGERERITLIAPRFAVKGEDAVLRLHIENRGRNTLAFAFDLQLGGFVSADGKSSLGVTFDEELYEKSDQYDVTIPITAPEGTATEGMIRVENDKAKLTLSGSPVDTAFGAAISVGFAKDSVAGAIDEYYRNMSVDNVALTGMQIPIYLARLSVTTTEDTLIIESCENVPFGQYVGNIPLMESLMEVAGEGGGSERSTRTSQSQVAAAEGMDRTRIAQGVYDLMVEGGRKGEVSYSAPIAHGLGLGRVAVTLGIEEKDGDVIYGSSDIFDSKEERAVDVDIAAKVNEDDGSFIIGARLKEQSVGGHVRIHWTALRDERTVYEKSEKRIFIKPNLLELGVRESYALECVCENMMEKSVTWSVHENGGYIDETGLYTAPNDPGVYEVMAQSTAYPDVKAAIFVVVRGA
ncbi:MAG: hypothetical protein IJT32_00550 [Lachnospiraceae bacterium]|nr:hypothetical protein [Lachnospiraceae bacterium]